MLKRLDVIEDHEDRFPRTRPHVIPRQVPGNLKHPRAFAAIGVVLGAERPKKRFLGQVLGGLSVAEKAPEEPVDRLPESREQTLDQVAMHSDSLLAITPEEGDPLISRSQRLSMGIDRSCRFSHPSHRHTMGITNEPPDLLPGTLDLLILRILTRGTLHGYGIAQHLKVTSDEVLQVGESSLYPALQRLLLNGWVKAEWGASENNRRARYYTITPLGKKRLTAERQEFARIIGAIQKVLETA